MIRIPQTPVLSLSWSTFLQAAAAGGGWVRERRRPPPPLRRALRRQRASTRWHLSDVRPHAHTFGHAYSSDGHTCPHVWLSPVHAYSTERECGGFEL
ncbi:hypothetical protein U9M48_040675 [Paspalum notatum var. saurae]|uniref:Uncharacterized protein n=1 Tax=Paspalum notatum var. saurae TaxID=547442 RepID=A0AAQ3UMM1_PASNO